MHFLVAFAPKINVQLEFLLVSKIDLASASRAVCPVDVSAEHSQAIGREDHVVQVSPGLLGTAKDPGIFQVRTVRICGLHSMRTKTQLSSLRFGVSQADRSRMRQARAESIECFLSTSTALRILTTFYVLPNEAQEVNGAS